MTQNENIIRYMKNCFANRTALKRKCYSKPCSIPKLKFSRVYYWNLNIYVPVPPLAFCGWKKSRFVFIHFQYWNKRIYYKLGQFELKTSEVSNEIQEGCHKFLFINSYKQIINQRLRAIVYHLQLYLERTLVLILMMGKINSETSAKTYWSFFQLVHETKTTNYSKEYWINM